MSLSVEIEGYEFDCVPLVQANFEETSAVYMIVCAQQDGTKSVIEVGETFRLQSKLKDHESDCRWNRNCVYGRLWACVHPMPSEEYSGEDRIALVKMLRERLNPVCEGKTRTVATNAG